LAVIAVDKGKVERAFFDQEAGQHNLGACSGDAPPSTAHLPHPETV